jgi:hypothetical protein
MKSRQEMLTLRDYLSLPSCFSGVHVAHVYRLLHCAVLCVFCIFVCLLLSLFSFCVLFTVLPVSLDYPFLISPAIFADVYWTIISREDHQKFVTLTLLDYFSVNISYMHLPIQINTTVKTIIS